jgi:hypothetical protein
MIEKVFRIAQDLQYKEKCKAVRSKRKKNIGDIQRALSRHLYQ